MDILFCFIGGFGGSNPLFDLNYGGVDDVIVCTKVRFEDVDDCIVLSFVFDSEGVNRFMFGGIEGLVGRIEV